ncbi:MAG: glycosyltransferase family 2 protein [Gemmatimonadaceae bacterium]|nr:glycosyltransferase family 2 protein [Gemmatimonadaceae bacterium]
MRVSVAICTRNRCRALSETLRALANVIVPPALALEVLVVDNASTDGTTDAVARFADSLPLRTVVEPRVGLSHARNAAIALARGDYLIWVDDDVLVEPGWLSAYHDAFCDWPDAAFFGGPIAPVFEGVPPAWLRDALPEVGNAYAALDLGVAPIALSREVLPFGANMAIRAAEQRLHRFDPMLGRRGDLLYAGEEWAVLVALLDAGATGRWVPGARVRHVIPVERQSVGYLRRYYAGNGASHARVRAGAGEAMLFGRPRWLWREAFAQEAAYQLRRRFTSSDLWSAHLRRASLAWGMLRAPASPGATRRPASSADEG